MASTALSDVYATDEDLWLVGSSDWPILVPQSQMLATGTNGAISAGAWSLTSATVDFEEQGVAAGHIVRLSSPRETFKRDVFLAVESSSAGTLTLRRPGMATGKGAPPSASAVTSVAFDVFTFDPQIENAAYEMHQKFGVDAGVAYREPSNLYDRRCFRRLTALWVLYTEYLQSQRTGDGDFPLKVKAYKSAYDEQLASAQVLWGSDGNQQPPTNRFGMRISR